MTGRAKSGRLGILLVSGLAGASLALSGCLDIGLMTGIAFPPTIRGLPADQPYVAFPVGAWVTEGGVEALGLAGCFASSCEPQAAVGLFRARGADAARLARIADDPGELIRSLGPDRRPPAGSKARISSVISAERIREDGWRGFAVRLARQDGSRPAFGAVLLRPSGGATSILVVIGPSDEATRRVAREAAAQAG